MRAVAGAEHPRPAAAIKAMAKDGSEEHAGQSTKAGVRADGIQVQVDEVETRTKRRAEVTWEVRLRSRSTCLTAPIGRAASGWSSARHESPTESTENLAIDCSRRSI